jgi:hypothetical protein
VKIVAVQGVFALISWFLWHGSNQIWRDKRYGLHIYYKQEQDQEEVQDQEDNYKPTLNPEDSLQKPTINFAKVMVTLMRAILAFISQFVVFMTYYFVAQSKDHLNSGIISSIFSSTILYSTLIFYFLFN